MLPKQAAESANHPLDHDSASIIATGGNKTGKMRQNQRPSIITVSPFSA
jgi:hypothetical protein